MSGFAKIRIVLDNRLSCFQARFVRAKIYAPDVGPGFPKAEIRPEIKTSTEMGCRGWISG